MDLIHAVLMGIVQGITEWLPISSTAHLRILPALLGIPDPGAAFTAVIQLGTTLAVLIYFRHDLAKAIGGWVKSLFGGPKDLPEVRLAWGAFWGTLPIIAVGILGRHWITGPLRSLYVIATTLIVFGLVMWAADRYLVGKREMKDVTVKDGLIVGLFQCLALIPGVSRSGSTLVGSFLAGLDRPTAARFSFLLSVPSILGAGLFELYNEREGILGQSLPMVLVASAVSFVVGYATIAWLIRYLQRNGLGVFIVYRLVLGVLLLVLLQQGILKPLDEVPPENSPVAAGR